MSMIITILEISQKQAFIFSSNKLKDNIHNSDVIAYVTSPDYIEKIINDEKLFNEKDNLVYAGGGHTIMEFPSLDNARKVISIVTLQLMKDYPEMEVFSKSLLYDNSVSPKENIANLTNALESKKALRNASFHSKSFGIEGNRLQENINEISERDNWIPEGFTYTNKLEDLGDSESNFIAVVHIDGNAMGKRISDIAERKEMSDWNVYKSTMKAFSMAIDKDFKQAYKEMCICVAKAMCNEDFANKISLKIDNKQSGHIFPIRRIISEGDDICFVANGKIGIDCAAVFIKALSKKINPIDKKKYSACAGVAIVHQKYPFYRAYELSESLCSNAKKYGAGLSKDGTGSDISCIDWHIEYGELQDSLEETRKQYDTDDGKRLELRPYIVDASAEIINMDQFRKYENFKNLLNRMRKNDEKYGRGFMKNMRPVIKKGERALDYYLHFHKADDIKRDAYQGIYTETDFSKIKIGDGAEMEKKMFVSTKDGKNRSIIFDAIEVMDNCILLGEEPV